MCFQWAGGMSGGLALFWQEKLNVSIRNFGRFVIDANVGEVEGPC